VADGAEAFADRLVQLLGDTAGQARLAEAGRQYIERHFVWSQSVEKLERMCMAAAGSTSGV
jgi:hypothetical protein